MAGRQAIANAATAPATTNAAPTPANTRAFDIRPGSFFQAIANTCPAAQEP
jgi:hypothetical protein